MDTPALSIRFWYVCQINGVIFAEPDPEGLDARGYIDDFALQIKRMQEITDKLQGITRYETMGYAGNTIIIDIRKASDAEWPARRT